MQIAEHPTSFRDDSKCSQEGFSSDNVADVYKGIVSSTGNVYNVHGRTTGASYLMGRWFLNKQFLQRCEVTSVKVHAHDTVLQSLSLAHMTALSITEGPAPTLCLIDGSTEQFAHKCPLYLLRVDTCIDW